MVARKRAVCQAEGAVESCRGNPCRCPEGGHKGRPYDFLSLCFVFINIPGLFLEFCRDGLAQTPTLGVCDVPKGHVAAEEELQSTSGVSPMADRDGPPH